MKVLITIKNIHGAKGGAERILSQLSSFLAQRGHEISIVSFDGPDPEPFYQIDQRVVLKGLEKHAANRRTSLLGFVRRTLSLRIYIQTYRPDVVVSFMHSSMAITALSLLFTSIPMVGSEHTVKDHYKGKPLQYFLLCFSVLLSRKTTVISEGILKSFPKWLQNRLEIISNPVSEPHFSLLPDAEDNKIVTTVGRLAAEKNQETLIRAMRLVNDQFPDWKLRIFGDGPLRASLEKVINELKLEEVVSLEGSTSQLYDELLKADIFVFASVYESFGLALAEALQIGLPSVAFKNVEGVDGLIKDQVNGILISASPRNHHAVASCLIDLIENKNLRAKLSRAASSENIIMRNSEIFTRWERLLKEA